MLTVKNHRKNRAMWAKITQFGSILLLTTGLMACSSGGSGDSTPPVQLGTECTRTGVQIARDFGTNLTHNATGTGCTRSVPILSDASPTRDGTPLVTANADGKTMISAHVFVPAHTAGQRFPVVLHSHGWSVKKLTAKVTRTTNKGDMFATNSEIASNLVDYDGGYIVISFDERGWGQSEGEIAVKAPERETQDAKAVIDWIVAEGKAGRLPVQFDDAAETDPRLGSIGVSYGGAFQFLLAAEDPRLDTIVPFGTWHDLIYSLTPHRFTNDTNFAPGVFKQTFTSGLCLLSIGPNPALTSSTGNRDDVLVQACNPALAGMRFREQWDATNTILPFGKTHTMRWYQHNGTPLLAADSKSGLAPGAGFARRGAIPTLLWQGTDDILFNFNEGMWNYNYLKSLSPTVEVKLLTNNSGHMSSQWTGQTVEGSNCGRLTVEGTVRAWFKKYLKNQPADWAALNVPNICMNLNTPVRSATSTTQKGVSLNAPVVGGTPVLAQSQAVTLATMGANAYVFKKIVDITASNQMLAGVPLLQNVSVCAPAPLPCNNNATVATESLALIAVGIKRAGVVKIVDHQVFPIRGMDATPGKDFFLPGVAESLQVGDEVGLIFFAKHPQYDRGCFLVNQGGDLGPFTPPCAVATAADYYDFTADVALPILTDGAGGVVTHTGVEP